MYPGLVLPRLAAEESPRRLTRLPAAAAAARRVGTPEWADEQRLKKSKRQPCRVLSNMSHLRLDCAVIWGVFMLK
jgi:hypothetical protein